MKKTVNFGIKEYLSDDNNDAADDIVFELH